MRPYLPYQPHYSPHLPILHHRHTELATIQRSRLLWEESLHLSQQRTLYAIEQERALALYAQEQSTNQRELRMLRFIEQSKEQSHREMDQLRRRVLQEQVEYQDHIKRMELEKSYHQGTSLPYNSLNHSSMHHASEPELHESTKNIGQNSEGVIYNLRQDKAGAQSTYRDRLNQDTANNSAFSSFRPIDSKQHPNKNADSAAKAPLNATISYDDRVDKSGTEELDQTSVPQQGRRRNSIIKDTSRKKVFTFSKQNKRVQFEGSRSRSKKRSTLSPRKSELLNISERKLKGDPATDAQQRIVNRLKHSEVVYKDSEFRNIKHEMDHLLNTYDNERKVRAEVRNKINNHPPIVATQGMVVEV